MSSNGMGGLVYNELNTFWKVLFNDSCTLIIALCVLAFSLLHVITFEHREQEYDFVPSLWVNTDCDLQGRNISTSDFYPPMSKNTVLLNSYYYYTTSVFYNFQNNDGKLWISAILKKILSMEKIVSEKMRFVQMTVVIFQ